MVTPGDEVPHRDGKLVEKRGERESPLKYVADLVRLEVVKKVIGDTPMSRQTRDSMLAISFIHAMGHYDEPAREGMVKLDRLKSFMDRMTELSPMEEGMLYEVATRLLAPTPPHNVILGSPYDRPPEGLLDPLMKKPEEKKGLIRR